MGHILHLYWECPLIQYFWNDINEGINLDTLGHLSASSIFYGIKNKLFCTIVFSAKNYIYQCWVGQKLPKWDVYKHILTCIRDIEFTIAKEKNVSDLFLEKWEPLEELL